MVSVAQKIKALREKLEARKQRKQREQFEKEIQRSKRREAVQQKKEKLRDTVQRKVVPARVEAAAARRELQKATEEFDPIVVPGGQTVAAAGSKAKAGGKRAAAAAQSAVEAAELPDDSPASTAMRAQRAAEAGPPVEGVSLSPAAEPRRQERMGRGEKEIPDDSLEALAIGGAGMGESSGMAGMVMDDGGGGGMGLLALDSGDADGDDPLSVSSPLLNVGDDR
jgi:hypothetical protein